MSQNQSLTRALGLGSVIAFVIANIIGSGVYKKVAPMASELDSSGWVLVAWVIAGFITLFGAWSYAEITGLLADTGGEYAYYKKNIQSMACLHVWLVDVYCCANSFDIFLILCLFSIAEFHFTNPVDDGGLGRFFYRGNILSIR